jgi:hypothetical protein
MARRLIPGLAAIVSMVHLDGRRSDAQAITSLADDIIISKGQPERQKAQTETHLGVIHGTSERPFASSPGSGESRMGDSSPPALPGSRH